MADLNESPVANMTTEELERVLEQRRVQERRERERARLNYESERDEIVGEIVKQATDLSTILKNFKDGLHSVFNDHQVRLQGYGGIRSNSKGGFSLVHSSGQIKASRIRATQPQWDERSTKAIELISDFMQDTVKKKDLKLYEILKSFIEKNDKGELEYSKVMHLFKHKDKYDDPRWTEGLNLIQESYSINLRGYGYEFHMKDDQGKWQKIEINFTSI
jgi:hypothetical protein